MSYDVEKISNFNILRNGANNKESNRISINRYHNNNSSLICTIFIPRYKQQISLTQNNKNGNTRNMFMSEKRFTNLKEICLRTFELCIITI